jgi:glycosyltransferase involved in cell wall biosynthesis
MLRCGQDRHEFWIALNASFPTSVESIRRQLGGTLLPSERIVTWQAEGPVAANDVRNEQRLERGLAMREAFLDALRPDFVHIASLFEGMNDDSLHSIPAFTEAAPTAVTLYDLIPLLNRGQYLPNSIARDWYYRQLDSLRRARLLLAISESSRREALSCLDWPEDRVINISSAVDTKFRRIGLDAATTSALRQKFGLHRPFVMCAGVVEVRKNVDALIRAFAALPRELRDSHQLLLVGKVGAHDHARFAELLRKEGLEADAVIMTGFVEDDELIRLYNLCKLFVFPSWHEGFGLPALEAMACGAPVIAAGTSSLPEVVGRTDALFDPHDDISISTLMAHVLRDDTFRASLSSHSLERAKQFSWEETACRALAAMEEAAVRPTRPPVRSEKRRLAYVPLASAEQAGIVSIWMRLADTLATHFDIELVTDMTRTASAVPISWPVRSTRWFGAHAGVYDRVLYQTSDLPCSEAEVALMGRVPGVVLVHPGSPKDIAMWFASNSANVDAMRTKLYRSWGYRGLLAEAEIGNTQAALLKYPAVYADLEAAEGVVVMAAAGNEKSTWDPGERAHKFICRLQSLSSPPGRDDAEIAVSDTIGTAIELHDAIERFHERGRNLILRRALADLAERTADLVPEAGDVANIAQALADNFPPNLVQRQLLVDISRLVIMDAGSGIQRAVRSHLMNLLCNPPAGFRVEPVYARHEEGFYRYARGYSCRFLGIGALAMEDDRIDAAPDDVFLGLDLAADIIPGRKEYFLDLRRRGVAIHFVFYDAIAGRHPDWFPEDLSNWMRRWYRTIAEISDGVVAISRASAEDLRDWLDEAGLQRSRPLPISWAHLGADVEASVPSRGIDGSIMRVIDGWRGSHTFLMVGTVEPRKGQDQALDAFERIWASGRNERLVIVGRQGWRMEAFAARLRRHPELGRHLFWFEGISDEALQALYSAASALLAGSFAEGFGLPLIEAAQHRLPILARNLPVFREVAGDAAVYFDASEAETLAGAIDAWVKRADNGDLPDVSKLRYLTWAESTRRLLAAIESKRPCVCWQPGNEAAVGGHDLQSKP